MARVDDRVPRAALRPPASLARELTRFGTPADLRIDRWAADIADAVEKLRHYVPDTLLPAAKSAATDGATGGSADSEKAGPLTEAYWIKAALTAKNSGTPASTAAAVEAQHATDQDGEVAWLVRVATAYRTVPQDRAAQVLAAALSAAPGPSTTTAAPRTASTEEKA